MAKNITIYAECKKYEFNTDMLECEGLCPDGVAASLENNDSDVMITLPGGSIVMSVEQFGYYDSAYIPANPNEFDPAKHLCKGGKSVSGSSCEGYLKAICSGSNKETVKKIETPVKIDEKTDVPANKTGDTTVITNVTTKTGKKELIAKYKDILLAIPEYAGMVADLDPDYPSDWEYLVVEILLLKPSATVKDVEQMIAELAGGSDKEETPVGKKIIEPPTTKQEASQDQLDEKSDYSTAGDNGLKFSKPADWKPGQFVMLDDSDKTISPIPLTKLDDSEKSNTPASLNAFDLDAIIKNNKLNANKVELNGYPALVVSGTKAAKTAIISLMETKWPDKSQFYLYVITNKLANKGKLAAVLMNDYIKGIQSEPDALFGKIVTYHKGKAIDADQSYKLSYVDAKSYQELEPAKLDQIEETYLLLITNKELQTEETIAAQVKWLETQNCIFMETTEIQ